MIDQGRRKLLKNGVARNTIFKVPPKFFQTFSKKVGGKFAPPAPTSLIDPENVLLFLSLNLTHAVILSTMIEKIKVNNVLTSR